METPQRGFASEELERTARPVAQRKGTPTPFLLAEFKNKKGAALRLHLFLIDRLFVLESTYRANVVVAVFGVTAYNVVAEVKLLAIIATGFG